MTNSVRSANIDTTEATVVATAETTVVAEKAPKAPSKKSLAVAIFAAKMADRAAGKFASNKDFRAAVLRAIESELSVSTASAATMYNSCKVEAEAADAAVALGRDPKKEKVKVEGVKRGRPQGSKNKDKAQETVVVSDATAALVEGDATPAEAPVVEQVAATEDTATA